MIINIIRRPAETFVAENGRIYKEEFSEGIIIRDETLINVEDKNRGIAPVKSEGEKVAKGESVYRYYVENEQDIKNKIEGIDLQIQNNINDDNSYFSTDIKLINNQIDKSLDNLYENSNNIQNVIQEKSNINSQLTQKIKLKAENSENEELAALIKERNEYEESLKNNSEYVAAENSGIVSYRIDGLEEKLKTDDFSYLTEDYFKNTDIQTGQIIALTSDSGKIIDNFKCYIACLLNSEESRNTEVGKSVKLRLQTSEEIPAKVAYKAVQPDQKVIIVFEICNNVSQLVQYRKTSLDVIWWSASGLKIPNKALKYEGEVAYVIRNRAGLKEKIFVKVLKSNDRYSIVKNYTYSELEELGYDSKTLQNKKSISIYDEIEI